MSQPESPLDANRRYNALLEAMHTFKSAVLEYYGHEVVAAQAALQAAGIISPSIVTGINDLARLYKTNRDAIVDEMRDELAEEMSRPGPYRDGYEQGMQYMIDFVERGDIVDDSMSGLHRGSRANCAVCSD